MKLIWIAAHTENAVFYYACIPDSCIKLYIDVLKFFLGSRLNLKLETVVIFARHQSNL
jgi:hypothetical protein